MATLLDDSQASIERASRALREGELVAVPTETVYGLAANALDSVAVRKIFEIKGRPLADPLIVHVLSLEEAEPYADISDLARRLTEALWPGPLTIVLPKRECIPDLVSAGLPSVALRAPEHPLMRQLLSKSQLPLAAPSANPFGYISPTQAAHVQDSLGTKLKFILDGGHCHHGLESTIVDLRDPKQVKILRPGPICTEMLSQLTNLPVIDDKALVCDLNNAQTAPGRFSRHYSPKTNLFLEDIKSLEHVQASAERAQLFIKRPQESLSEHQYCMSEDGDLETCARVLFDLLRKLDQLNYKAIHCEWPPAKGIGIAMRDRLMRAGINKNGVV